MSGRVDLFEFADAHLGADLGREKPKGSVRDSCTGIDQQQAGFSFFELPWSCSE